jgi:hypothetical protein
MRAGNWLANELDAAAASAGAATDNDKANRPASFDSRTAVFDMKINLPRN